MLFRIKIAKKAFPGYKYASLHVIFDDDLNRNIMDKFQKVWRICIAIFIVLTIISFTPIIIPQDKFKPELLGIPYTLWTGFLLTLFLVILTLIGTRVHPGAKEKEGEK